jgi:hypothetical protein
MMASLAFVVPPAVLAAGVLVDVAGLRATFAVFAAGNLMVAVAVLLGRLRRRL